MRQAAKAQNIDALLSFLPKHVLQYQDEIIRLFGISEGGPAEMTLEQKLIKLVESEFQKKMKKHLKKAHSVYLDSGPQDPGSPFPNKRPKVSNAFLAKEAEENLEGKIRKALKDEGGAAGMGALEDHTKSSEEKIKNAIKGMQDVGLHKNGDYILDDEKQIDVEKNMEEASSMAGGNVAGYAGGTFPGLDVEKENEDEKKKSHTLEEEAELIEGVMNYLLRQNGAI